MSDSSTSALTDLKRLMSPYAVWGRRIFLMLLGALIVANFAGLLGVRTATVSAEQNGWELSLDYPATARAGWDVKWHVEVRHAGGFGKQLTLTVTSDWFDIFETQGLWPEATSQRRDGELVYLTFDAPPGDTFELDYDTYVQPTSQIGRSAELSVLDGGQPVVSVQWTTTLVP